LQHAVGQQGFHKLACDGAGHLAAGARVFEHNSKRDARIVCGGVACEPGVVGLSFPRFGEENGSI